MPPRPPALLLLLGLAAGGACAAPALAPPAAAPVVTAPVPLALPATLALPAPPPIAAVADPSPPPPTAPTPPPVPPLPPAPRLTSRGYVTWIYARPRADGHFIGYLRNGSSVALRSTELVAGEGCRGGFYPVAPRGFVCNDRTVTRAPSPRAVETSAAAARAPGPFPYRYAFSDGAPMYNRIPRAAEQRRAEGGFGPAGDERRAYAHPSAYQDLTRLDPIPAVDPLPSFLAAGGTTAEDRRGLVKETLPAGSILSFTRAFAAEGRTWLLSADQSLVPADRVRAFAPSAFHGVRLDGDDGVRLPLAWMRGAPRPQYRRLPSGAFAQTGRAWPVRSFARLTGAVVEQERRRWHETLDRDDDGAPLFILDDDATLAEAATRQPLGVERVAPGRKWIEVSITRGTLVAYEGLTPVYATLVSPGRGGVPVPGREGVADSTTPIGTYTITFKDRAATMSPDPPGTREHFISDVPFVQYFKAPFALHAAVWHERFGEPASAGCVNLAPLDAEALFGWTDPQVPEDWQGATGAAANGATTAIVVRR